MADRSAPRVLLVDDEPGITDGLALLLERELDVVTASSGAAGLGHLALRGPFAVIVSDLRRPGMDGAEFLGRARAASPESVRVLHYGPPDPDALAATLRRADVFRLVPKPATSRAADALGADVCSRDG